MTGTYTTGSRTVLLLCACLMLAGCSNPEGQEAETHNPSWLAAGPANCDTEARSPLEGDPAAGREIAEIDASRAVKACKAAVKRTASAENYYHLGRAYEASYAKGADSKAFADAADAYDHAAAMGMGLANARMAQISRLSLPGRPASPENAKAYYHKAFAQLTERASSGAMGDRVALAIISFYDENGDTYPWGQVNQGELVDQLQVAARQGYARYIFRRYQDLEHAGQCENPSSPTASGTAWNVAPSGPAWDAYVRKTGQVQMCSGLLAAAVNADDPLANVEQAKSHVNAAITYSKLANDDWRPAMLTEIDRARERIAIAQKSADPAVQADVTKMLAQIDEIKMSSSNDGYALLVVLLALAASTTGGPATANYTPPEMPAYSNQAMCDSISVGYAGSGDQQGFRDAKTAAGCY